MLQFSISYGLPRAFQVLAMTSVGWLSQWRVCEYHPLPLRHYLEWSEAIHKPQKVSIKTENKRIHHPFSPLSLRAKRSNPQPLIIYLFTKKKKNSLLTINIKTEKKKIINRIIMPYTEIATNLRFSQWQCGLSTLVSHTEIATGLWPSQWEILVVCSGCHPEIATGLWPSQWRAWNKWDCHELQATLAMTSLCVLSLRTKWSNPQNTKSNPFFLHYKEKGDEAIYNHISPPSSLRRPVAIHKP